MQPSRGHPLRRAIPHPAKSLPRPHRANYPMTPESESKERIEITKQLYHHARYANFPRLLPPSPSSSDPAMAIYIFNLAFGWTRVRRAGVAKCTCTNVSVRSPAVYLDYLLHLLPHHYYTPSYMTSLSTYIYTAVCPALALPSYIPLSCALPISKTSYIFPLRVRTYNLGGVYRWASTVLGSLAHILFHLSSHLSRCTIPLFFCLTRTVYKYLTHLFRMYSIFHQTCLETVLS
ncbi:hypothetical protein C8R46DRAFT_1108857 [Mycena filopes]|nr:hypothetical protein C8R46DRAFT_1108857 [Mycena filopes]